MNTDEVIFVYPTVESIVECGLRLKRKLNRAGVQGCGELKRHYPYCSFKSSDLISPPNTIPLLTRACPPDHEHNTQEAPKTGRKVDARHHPSALPPSTREARSVPRHPRPAPHLRHAHRRPPGLVQAAHLRRTRAAEPLHPQPPGLARARHPALVLCAGAVHPRTSTRGRSPGHMAGVRLDNREARGRVPGGLRANHRRVAVASVVLRGAAGQPGGVAVDDRVPGPRSRGAAVARVGRGGAARRREDGRREPLLPHEAAAGCRRGARQG